METTYQRVTINWIRIVGKTPPWDFSASINQSCGWGTVFDDSAYDVTTRSVCTKYRSILTKSTLIRLFSSTLDSRVREDFHHKYSLFFPDPGDTDKRTVGVVYVTTEDLSIIWVFRGEGSEQGCQDPNVWVGLSGSFPENFRSFRSKFINVRTNFFLQFVLGSWLNFERDTNNKNDRPTNIIVKKENVNKDNPGSQP